MEALARHQAVAECDHDDKGLHDRLARGRQTEETADVPTVPCRLGDVAVVLGPVAPLAGAALDLDVERGPPLPIVRGGAGMAQPSLAGGAVFEAAFGVQRGERAVEVARILGRQVAAQQAGECLVHGEWPANVFDFE